MTPENTSKRPPEEHLLGLVIEGQSRYIENMEASGQGQLVNSDVLPIEVQRPDTDADLEALGFVFGDPVDELFREAILPDGWRKQASDHDMWSYVVDAEGNERVAVFYKAAFYDRHAFMRLQQFDGGT